MHVDVLMRDEKEERKKQARSNKQTRQSNTAHPRQSLFLEKMSCLRWDSMFMYITCGLEVWWWEDGVEGGVAVAESEGCSVATGTRGDTSNSCAEKENFSIILL